MWVALNRILGGLGPRGEAARAAKLIAASLRPPAGRMRTEPPELVSLGIDAKS
jgi:hypothetical protein